jgi:glycosyltransferase involved in cell wall biosynthesis
MSHTKPHISIITVCYNSEATIIDTLASVAAQDWPDREHLIIDGASTDNTAKLVADFIAEHPHLDIQWYSARDSGLYDAMNKGISLAKEGIIGLLNADDFYTGPQVLSKVAACFEDENVAGLYADLQYVDGQAKARVVRKWKSGPYKKHAFLWGWMPPHPSFFCA